MQILCIPLNQDRSLLSSYVPFKISCTEFHVHPLTAKSNKPNIVFFPGATTPIGGCILQPSSGL